MVDKLKIKAYLDDHFRQEDSENVFVAQINPTQYTDSGRIEYEADMGIDSAGSTPSLSGIPPRVLALDLVLDGTGAIPGEAVTVTRRVETFRKVVYSVEKDLHGPRRLWILWGSLSFKCVLRSYDVEYTLFDPSGLPLRAKLKASFESFDAPDTIALNASQQSADLTHRRVVTSSDTLPLLCAGVYGDTNCYLQVARHNALVGFRHLVPGTTLIFPPLRELEAMSSSP